MNQLALNPWTLFKIFVSPPPPFSVPPPFKLFYFLISIEFFSEFWSPQTHESQTCWLTFILTYRSKRQDFSYWGMEGSCPTSQKLTLWSLYIQVMLILILINVHYLQNIFSSFREDSNGRNHSLSDFHYPRFPTLPVGEFLPLKNTGDGSIYIPAKLQRVEVFSSESISYLNL